jgi:hypothetical protein
VIIAVIACSYLVPPLTERREDRTRSSQLAAPPDPVHCDERMVAKPAADLTKLQSLAPAEASDHVRLALQA